MLVCVDGRRGVLISPKRLATVAVPARGLPVRLAATLTESGGAPIAGEPIRFVIDDVTVCAADTDGTGRASCAVSGTWTRPVRLHGYDAVYDGNATYLPPADHA